MSRLQMTYFSRYEISSQDLEEMYGLFCKYYNKVDFKTFRNDLDKKNGAYLIRKKDDNSIVGFSTLLEMKMRINGKKVIGIFSGDTVIEEAYWGKTSLNVKYFKYFFKKLLSHPFTPVYWFLISKGYKTYLLLANNFLTYYPCHSQENKQLADIAAAYSRYLFPDYYDEKKGIIDFGATYPSLKGGVAEITPDMCRNNRKIAYFNEKNPTWQRGTELPCVGELSIKAAIFRFFKPMRTSRQGIRKGMLRSKSANTMPPKRRQSLNRNRI